MELQYKRISTVGERLIAFVIDHFIITILFMIGVFNSILILGEDHGLIFVIIFILAVPCIYGLKDFVNGRSIGKRLFGIGVRCIENPDEVPSKWRLFLRNITILIWPVEFFVLIFNSNGIRLGDMLAKTIVVKLVKDEGEHNEALEEYKIKYENSNPINVKKVLKITLASIAVFITLIGVFIGSIGSFMKGSGAYKTTINQIENSEEIINEIGNIEGYGIMPTGSISITNGYGEATLKVKVKGETRDIKVFSKLYKEPNSQWKIVEFNIIN